LDFAAYGIDIKFDEEALRRLARDAFVENTGARGLVSAVENALIVFEKSLPSRKISRFPVTREVIEKPEQALKSLFTDVGSQKADDDFEGMIKWEMDAIRTYLTENQSILTDRYRLKMTPSKMDNVAVCYSRNVMDIGRALDRIRALYDDIKAIELDFYKRHDINVILEEDAIDFVIGQLVRSETTLEQLTLQLTEHFELGLKLAMEKTARNRFFLNRWALENPEDYMRNLFKQPPSPNSASETERLDPT
jgi:hypothetical protein